jgi:hypothetical protein
MKKYLFLLTVILAFSLILTGCGGAAKNEAAYDRVEMSKPMEAPMASAAPQHSMSTGFASDMKAEMDMVVSKQEAITEESMNDYGTLGDAIEMFCAGEFEEEITCFDENGILKTIGELTAGDGKRWKAYYEDEGQSKAFESIKDQTLAEGKTVVIVLE